MFSNCDLYIIIFDKKSTLIINIEIAWSKQLLYVP